jgi:hypothetical protein
LNGHSIDAAGFAIASRTWKPRYNFCAHRFLLGQAQSAFPEKRLCDETPDNVAESSDRGAQSRHRDEVSLAQTAGITSLQTARSHAGPDNGLNRPTGGLHSIQTHLQLSFCVDRRRKSPHLVADHDRVRCRSYMWN